jgi:uncharacterized membrane protein required for colicin V production
VDRLLGAALGLVRALAIAALLATAGVALGLDRSPSWQDARCRPLLEALIDLVYGRLGDRLPRRSPEPRPVSNSTDSDRDGMMTIR